MMAVDTDTGVVHHVAGGPVGQVGGIPTSIVEPPPGLPSGRTMVVPPSSCQSTSSVVHEPTPNPARRETRTTCRPPRRRRASLPVFASLDDMACLLSIKAEIVDP